MRILGPITEPDLAILREADAVFLDEIRQAFADWYHFAPEVLARASSRIANEVRGVSRVVYDISSKPPATVEWE